MFPFAVSFPFHFLLPRFLFWTNIYGGAFRAFLVGIKSWGQFLESTKCGADSWLQSDQCHKSAFFSEIDLEFLQRSESLAWKRNPKRLSMFSSISKSPWIALVGNLTLIGSAPVQSTRSSSSFWMGQSWEKVVKSSFQPKSF